ncbi:hypothetical protein EON65_06150 [archaeon]|nr:MAG: hypothetical protein EON65_06150 [archaeon]
MAACCAAHDDMSSLLVHEGADICLQDEVYMYIVPVNLFVFYVVLHCLSTQTERPGCLHDVLLES